MRKPALLKEGADWHPWRDTKCISQSTCKDQFLCFNAYLILFFRNDTFGTINLKTTRQIPITSVPIEVKDAALVVVYYTSSNKDGDSVVRNR